MAITGSVLTEGVDGDGGASSTTASITPSANQLLLLTVCAGHATTNTVVAPSTIVGNGLTWTKVAERHDDASDRKTNVSVWRAMGTAPTAGAVTINFTTAPQNTLWQIAQFDGVVTTSSAAAIGATGTGEGNETASVDIGSPAATSALFGAVTKNTNSSAITPGVGFTELGTQATDSSPTITRFVEIRYEAGSGHSGVIDMSSTSASKTGLVGIEILAAAPPPPPPPPAGGAVTFRSSSTAASGAAVASLQVTKPAGVIDGDFLIAFVTIPADQTITAPAGWTLVNQATTGTATGDARQAIYRKVAASEGANYTWSFSAATDCAIAILAYTNVHATSPIQVSGHNLMAGSTLTHTAPSVQTTSDQTLALYAFGTNPGVVGDLTFTTPSGLTPRAEADPAGSTTNRAVLAVFEAVVATASLTEVKTTTLNNSAKSVAWTIVLAPSGAVPSEVVVQPQTPTSITTGCMLGWYDTDGYAALKVAEADLDTHFAVVRVYHSPTKFPDISQTSINEIVNDGRLVMVSHKPPHRGGAWQEIYDGKHSAAIDAWVTYYKSLAPKEVIFVFHHEPHDNCTDLKPEKGMEGVAADFVKAYRYIAKKFRDAAANNVLLGYCAVANTWATKKATNSTVPGSGDKCWPGSDVVDVLCHDEYNTVGEDHDPKPGTGSITYVGEEHATPAKSVANITVNVPSGRRSGDLLLALVHTDYCNLGTNTPSGWTQAVRREEGYGQSAAADPLYGGTDLCGYVYWKISNGTETNVTFTPAEQDDGTQSGNMFTATVAAFRGVDTANPIYDKAINPQTSGNQITCPSVSHAAGGLAVFFFIEDDEDPIYNPSGHTQISNYHGNPNNPDDTVHISYKKYSSSGTTGSQTAQHGGAVGQQSPNDMGISISLRPGPGGLYDYGTSWHSFEEEYAPSVELAKAQNKPLIFGEIGCNHSKPGGDRGEWFRNGAAWILNSQDARDYLKGFCYYHKDDHDGSGHWWRFVGDNTMFDGDGTQGYKDGFSSNTHFKTQPFSLLTENPATSALQPSGITSQFTTGLHAVRLVSGIFTISEAGAIASPSDYDVAEEEQGIEFGIATVVTDLVVSPTGLESELVFGTASLSRLSAAGYIFTPPVDYVVPAVNAESGPLARALFKYYGPWPRGRNVYVMNDGTITENPADLNEIATVYHGGHIIPITDEEEAALTAAGYGNYIIAAQ